MGKVKENLQDMLDFLDNYQGNNMIQALQSKFNIGTSYATTAVSIWKDQQHDQ